ncbi:MAG: hypothetical protein JSS28_03685 [Proteobacteria bacterium]|nr:hypothetical protein [Pseudomonadota bacterium]
MERPVSQSASALFADIPERGTTDNLLRTVQQHHVALSSMADTKANIVITMSSIVLTLTLARLGDPDLRVAALILGAFTLLSLLLAVLTVLPKYQPPKLNADGSLPPNFNLLFFGHFGQLSRDRYLKEVAQALARDGSPYATWAADIYSLGVYLAHQKYRYLRWSYLFFLAGFVLACAEQGWRLLTHAGA